MTNSCNVSLKKRIFSALPAVLLMIFIFINSSKTAVQSSADSDPIAETCLKVFEYIVGRYPEDVRPEKLDFSSTLVRKTAHVCEYALLSVLVSFHLYMIGFRRKKLIMTSVIFSSFYAVTDEFHQYFVEGRSCQFSDMCIDTIGSMLGALFFIIILLIFKKEY